MDFFWFQQQIVGFVIKQGLDKSWRFIFKRDPLVTSIAFSIKKTCSESEIDTLDYLLRQAFGKNNKLVGLIKTNYKTNPTIVISELSKSLIESGADFGNETEKKAQEISAIFIRCFGDELPVRESVAISTSQTTEATLKHVQSNGDVLNKILEKIERQDKVLLDNQIKKSISSEVSIAVAQDGNDDLANSKYKREIEEAKILLDREKHSSAKTIYEKLIEDFKGDPQVPMLAKFKVYNNLGACLAALGNRPEAAKSFRVAFDVIGPTSLIACKNRALASFFEGDPNQGLPFIDAAIALDAADNDSVNIKATLLRASGQLDKAIELYMDNEK